MNIDVTAAQLVVVGYLHMFLIEADFIHENSTNMAVKKIKQHIMTPTLRQFCCLMVT